MFGGKCEQVSRQGVEPVAAFILRVVARVVFLPAYGSGRVPFMEERRRQLSAEINCAALVFCT